MSGKGTTPTGIGAKVKKFVTDSLGRAGVIVKAAPVCMVCGLGEEELLGELFHGRSGSVHLRCVPAYLRRGQSDIAAVIAAYLAQREVQQRSASN